MATALSIDVHYDIIPPWCWMGKRHLAQAQAQVNAAADAGLHTDFSRVARMPTQGST